MDTTNKSYKKGLWLFLLLFIVFIIFNVIIGRYFYSLVLYHEIFDILIPCLIYLLLTKKPVLSTLKLDRKLNKKSVVIVFQLFLISFLLKMGINSIVMLTGAIDPTKVTMQVVDMAPNFLTLFIAVAILPAFLEEIIIRGVVLDQFQDTNLWQGAVMTGLLFGMMHIDIGQLGYATALGIVMGAIVILTGSLWGGILFHFLNNFLSVVVLSMLQLIQKFVPDEYVKMLETLAEAEMQTQTTSYMDIVSQVYTLIFAIACLAIGILLSKHYIKKLQKINEELSKEREDVIDDQQVEEHSIENVSWMNLFFNIPFMLILIVYIGINVISRV